MKSLRRGSFVVTVFLIVAFLAGAGCSSSDQGEGIAANSQPTPTPPSTPTPTPTPPPTPIPIPTFPPAPSSTFSHVVLVVEENHSYEAVIGNPDMPYLNSLATQYGLATDYYANTHPSIGNYFMLTVGSIVTDDDSFSGVVSFDNLVRRLVAAGKTWKSYAESMPYAGYSGDGAPPYLKRHNPFSYLSDVVNDAAQTQNLVPFSAFAGDLTSGNLPNFALLVPNIYHDAHDGTLTQADSWLKTNIEPLVANPAFQASGVLIILFDEGESADARSGGGHVPAVIVSAKGKPGYKSKTLYQHQSTLRLVLECLGVTQLPGAAATAVGMSEFFQ